MLVAVRNHWSIENSLRRVTGYELFRRSVQDSQGECSAEYGCNSACRFKHDQSGQNKKRVRTEDPSKIRKGNAPQAMYVIRHLALNMINRTNGKRGDVPKMRKKAGWGNAALERGLCRL